jgi:hypothetical protein
MTGMPITLEASAERDRIEAAERDRLIELETCCCARPIPCRPYLKRWSCARCGRLTDLAVRDGGGGSRFFGEASTLRGPWRKRRLANGRRK